jgi:hypothetical protein
VPSFCGGGDSFGKDNMSSVVSFAG